MKIALSVPLFLWLSMYPVDCYRESGISRFELMLLRIEGELT